MGLKGRLLLPGVSIQSGGGQTTRARHPQLDNKIPRVALGYGFVPWEMQVWIWVGEVSGSGRKRSLLRMPEAARG